MSERADALVIFGITGDLAKQMTLRALYRLEARGLLDCPIIGVAAENWTIERLRRARRRGDRRDRRARRPEASSRASPTGSRYVSGDFARRADVRARREGARRRAPARLLPRDPAVAVRDRRRRPRRPRTRCRPARASSSRSRSATISPPRASSPPSCTSTSTRRSSTGSTTSSARWGCRSSSTCASPTRCSSRSGTAATSRACRSRWPRSSASRTAATSTTPSGRCATSSSTTCCSCSRRPRRSRRRRPTPATLKDAKYAVLRSTADADPARYVRGQYGGYREIDGVARALDDRDLRGAAPRDRQLALGGRAVLHPHRQAAAGDADRGAARLPHPPRLGVRLRCATAGPSADQLVVRIDPDVGDPLVLDGAARRPARARRRSSSRRACSTRAARRRRPTRCCCTPRSRGDASRFTRQDSVEESWRIVAPLLDEPGAVQPYAPGTWGPGGRRSSSTASAAGTSRGSDVMTPPSRASSTSCVTATSVPSSSRSAPACAVPTVGERA